MKMKLLEVSSYYCCSNLKTACIAIGVLGLVRTGNEGFTRTITRQAGAKLAQAQLNNFLKDILSFFTIFMFGVDHIIFA